MADGPQTLFVARRGTIKRPYDPAQLQGLQEHLDIRISAEELAVAQLQGPSRREKKEKEPTALRILAALYLEAGIAVSEEDSHVKAEQFRDAAAAFYRREQKHELALAGADDSPVRS